MTKPLSMGIRERAMARLDAGERLPAMADALRRPCEVAGTQAHQAKRRSGQDRRACAAEDQGADADWLRGLVAEVAAPGLKVEDRTMWAFPYGEGLSFKKNRARQ